MCMQFTQSDVTNNCGCDTCAENGMGPSHFTNLSPQIKKMTKMGHRQLFLCYFQLIQCYEMTLIYPNLVVSGNTHQCFHFQGSNSENSGDPCNVIMRFCKVYILCRHQRESFRLKLLPMTGAGWIRDILTISDHFAFFGWV